MSNKKSNKEKTRPSRKAILAIWLIVVILPLLGVVSTFYCAHKGIMGFEPLPSFSELENPKSNLASEIITSDNKVIGNYFHQNRVNVRFKDLSPYLIDALVATEDERFFDHSGVDFKGTMRAVVNLGKAGGASTITQQLAKMLFKERESNFVKRVMQKIQEWILAAELEKRYTKNEIITMYLNQFDFLNNAVGIKSASNVYFSKDPRDLNLQEAAMLVGMAKNPSLFNPIRRPDTTKDRRTVVLHQMVRNNKITEQAYDSLKNLPLDIRYSVVDHKEGIAPYFREVLRAHLSDLFSQKDEDGNYVYAKSDGSPYNIYKDGLKIYTTLDYKMQKYGEWAVQQHLGNELQEDMFNDLKRRTYGRWETNRPFDGRLSEKQAEAIIERAKKGTRRYRVLTGVECANCGRRGDVIRKTKNEYICRAKDCEFHRHRPSADSIDIIFNTPVATRVFTWQGEKDTIISPIDSIKYYKSFLQAGMMSVDPHTGYIKAWVGGIDFKHFAYDHVYQSKRQVGSTFKPFVYSLAIQNGLSPCKEVPNQQVTFKKGDFGIQKDWTPKNSDGKYGCMVSLKYGLANSMNTITAWIMKRYGPQAVIDQARLMGIKSKLEPVPSLCLGVADLSVYEMVGANSVFANKGVYIKPTFITHIEDKNGNVIVDIIPESHEAMSEESAYCMLNLMKGVVTGVYNKCMGDRNGGRGYTLGTGMRLRGAQTERRPYAGIKYPVAAKTGTTQNNSDGWFIGITPDLVTGVWVGAEDRSVRFRRTALGQGANMALPIWGYYMHKVYDDPKLNISTGDFEKPEQPLEIELDCNKYKEGSQEPIDLFNY